MTDSASHDVDSVIEPTWLTAELTAWVRAHRGVLLHASAEFASRGRWPSWARLARTLAQREPPELLTTGPTGVPSALGHRSHSPDEVRLTLLGLGCTANGNVALDGYVRAIQLAAARYRDPEIDEPELSRKDLSAELGLEGIELSMVSRLIHDDHPFLGSGKGDESDWQYDIDDAITAFLSVGTREALLDRLAEHRIGPASVAPSVSKASPMPPSGDDGLNDIDRIVRAGVPAAAIESYGRWWQLESYLREIVYVELRARYGNDWQERLAHVEKRYLKDGEENAYMASADASSRLAYADVSWLLKAMDEDWPLFESSLLPHTRWLGRSDEVSAIRNRIAHCRSPHVDDPSRLRQLLRDLDSGARSFYSSYLTTHAAQADDEHPLVDAWVGGKHPTATRLLDHTPDRYGVTFKLRWSRRPWRNRQAPLSEGEGLLWHAEWLCLHSEPRAGLIWNRLRKKTRTSILHLTSHVGTVTATFPALLDAERTADAIGEIYDALITAGVRDRDQDPPPQVQENSVLAFGDRDLPFSLFGAEG